MEIWKDIKGFEGRYQISTTGRVKSLNYNKTKKEKILIQTDRGNGYKCVTLSINGKREQINVHRLVAEAFIPNPDNKPEIDHIKPVSEGGTNDVTNLKWVTRSENVNNKYTQKKRSISLTNRADQSKRIDQIDPITGEIVHQWKSTKECERNGYPSRQGIRNCCNGITRTYNNFMWKYLM